MKPIGKNAEGRDVWDIHAGSIEEEIRHIARYLGANEGESVSEYGKLIRAKLLELGEEIKENLDPQFPKSLYPNPSLEGSSLYAGAWNATRGAEKIVDAAVERMCSVERGNESLPFTEDSTT